MVAVDGRRFAEAIRPYLLPGGYAELNARIDAAGRLSPGAIRACGIEFSLDAAEIKMRVTIRASHRPIMSLDLARPRDRGSQKALPPASLSGYVNLLAGREYRTNDPAGGAAGWQAPVFDFDGALRAGKTVLEGVATYRGQQEVPWQRQDFRLVYDRPEDRVRSSLGDVNYGVRAFQSFRRMGGVAAARNLELQRGRSSAPAAATTLQVERYSRVDIWINGQRYQTLQLAPGRYDIRNFPFALGTNDVELHITDEVGREETIRFPFIFDSALLAAGEQDFSYAGGLLSQVTPSGRSYDPHEPAFSSYHDRGITDQFTAGGTAQGSRRQQMAGATGKWATSLGTLRADLSASRADFAPAGAAARLQYRYTNTAAPGDIHSWSAAATCRSPSFTALGDTAAFNPYMLELGLVYNRRLFWGVLGSFGAGREMGRGDQPDGDTQDVTLSRSFPRGLMASLVFNRRSPAANRTENRIMASISWALGSLDTVIASQDSATDSSRLQWHHSASRRVRSLDGDGVLARDRGGETAQGELHYRDYRFSAGAAGSLVHGSAPGSSASGGASLNAGTALAFAGGSAALSRPITDSFVLVTPHASLEGRPVEVNAGDEVPEAISGPLGPAVLPELSSYEEHGVMLSAPDLPPWTDLGPQPQYVYPGYRSGTRLTAGSGATIIIQGLLVDGAGEPMALEPGDLEELDAPGTPSRGFFTATTGRFAVEGIKPGRVRLVFRNHPKSPILLTIAPGRAGIVDFGLLSLPL